MVSLMFQTKILRGEDHLMTVKRYDGSKYYMMERFGCTVVP